MIRIIITVAVLCAIIGAAYWQGGRENRLQDEINNRNTLERMNDAIDPDLDDSGILDSLRTLAK